MHVIVVMEITMDQNLRRIDPGKVVAAFFAHSGIARVSRHWRPSDVCVLTFHGVRDVGEEEELLDADQHVPLELFRDICAHLAANYQVLPLREVVKAQREGKSLPHKTVAITFDDGYASNYLLAYPVLQALNLPATIFAAAGYLDGEVTMWFHRIELAFLRTQAAFIDFECEGHITRFELADREQRMRALGNVTRCLKQMPTTLLLEKLAKLERDLGVADEVGKNLPKALRPMSWDMARELQDSGLVEIGGHTYSHPILGRCTEEQQADEIRRSRTCVTERLGTEPKLFAYTNGKKGDFDATTQRLLREEGFWAAFTMMEAFLFPTDDDMAMPRYGCPSSTGYLEAIVSGSMAHFQSLRRTLGLVRAS